MPEKHTVTDKNGVEKTMIGWPTGLREHRIPTGNRNLDYRCPSCGRVGVVDRVNAETRPRCTNCRVKRFSPFVELEDEDAT